MKNEIHSRKKQTLNHLSRIQGQLNKLREYIEGDGSCEDIASLSTSIAKSFDSLRMRTLEGFILHELFEDIQVEDKDVERLSGILKLHKK